MTVTVKYKTHRSATGTAPSRHQGRRPGGVQSVGWDYQYHPERPSAEDEYTPEQRRIIDARLGDSKADFKAGRSFGPFNSADEMIAHMKAHLKKRAVAKKTKRSR
jgi:hypothetical protein